MNSKLDEKYREAYRKGFEAGREQGQAETRSELLHIGLSMGQDASYTEELRMKKDFIAWLVEKLYIASKEGK